MMGCFLRLTFLSISLLLSLTTADDDHRREAFSLSNIIPPLHLRHACHATRFPEQCLSSLTQSNHHHLPLFPTTLQIIHSAIAASNNTLTAAQSNVNSLLHHPSTAANVNRSMAIDTCLNILQDSAYRISLASHAHPRGHAKDARAWMSAALAYQYDCWSGLRYVFGNDTASITDTLALLEWLTGLSSNALSMMVSYDLFGSDTSSWKPPRTERDGFWEKSHGRTTKLGFCGGFPKNVKINATVCKDGNNGCYTTIQEAVNAAPDRGSGRFVIHIKAGVYEETVRIPIEKENVVFLGDGMGKTVITGSAHVGQPGVTTYSSATVAVSGDGFMAKNLTIENRAGPDAHQAVAFRSDSDRSVLDSCEFIANQDTLYAHSLRQFYKSCRIQGNVDFIFGNSASVFQDCEILVSPRQLQNPDKGENNAITAHGRTDPAESTGFVFINSVVNGTAEYLAQYRRNPAVHKTYLGRPWKPYARTVFVDCELEELVTAEGWMAWDGEVGLKTLYYGECGNEGGGSGVGKRVEWSSEIPREHVMAYSVSNFIQGNEWIPPFSQHR